MLDYNGIIKSATDDFGKFLFFGGVLLYIFSFIYPLEKEKELRLTISKFNHSIDDLNRKDSLLIIKVSKADTSISEYTKIAKTLIAQGNKDSAESYKPIVEHIYSEILKSNEDIAKIRNGLKSKKAEIIILEEYADKYMKYSAKLSTSGICFGIIGFILWAISYRLNFITKVLENKILKRKSNSDILDKEDNSNSSEEGAEN